MPTGYTHGVQEGKIATLRDYALTCARGMGVAITMRDEPADAPFPERFEPSTKYHDEHIADAQNLLDQIPNLSAAECDARALADFMTAMESHVKYATDKAAGKRRYQDMICQVEAWKPLPEIETLKTFMLEQLNTAMKFDYGGTYRAPVPIRLTGEQWREKTLAKASEDLAYHTVERNKEIDRTESRNAYLKAMRDSFPA